MSTYHRGTCSICRCIHGRQSDAFRCCRIIERGSLKAATTCWECKCEADVKRRSSIKVVAWNLERDGPIEIVESSLPDSGGWLEMKDKRGESYDCVIHGEGEGRDCPRC